MAQQVVDDVHLGRNGWLFLVGGSNHVIRYYTTPGAFPDELVAQWIALFEARRERSRALGAVYLHMIAPEKLTIYHDEFDEELPFRLQTPAFRLPAAARIAGLDDVIVDPVRYMMDQKSLYKLFWQTDTHWTFEGCLCAFQILCNKLGVQISSAIMQGITRRASLALDLGSKLSPPVREDFEIKSFLKGARRVAVNPIVAYKEKNGRENDGGLHVGSNVVYCNWDPSAVQKTVVLFGDSFAEYRPHLLTGMLAETFREVHFVWSTSVDWAYVERVKPDILLTEAAERFAVQVPRDDFDLDQYAMRCLASRSP